MKKREMTLAEFEEATTIRAAMKQYDKRRMEWNRQKKVDCDAFESELAAIRQKCKHWFLKYYPDAAGGSDSFERCDICGKEAKSL